MSKITFKQDSIGHFIGDNFLRVPIYQRSFAWERENVQELFDDIKNSYPNEYFIGTIVVNKKEDNDYLEIVDGQQRLATISIFYIAVRDFFREIGEDKKADPIERDYILKQSYREEDTKPRLKLNNIDNNFYFERLIKKQTTYSPTKTSHQRLEEIYNFLKEYITNKYKDNIDELMDLLDFIKDKLLIIVVTVSDDVNAFTVFETLNDRGLILSQTDLIKNYLFDKGGDKIEEAQNSWLKFTGAIEASINEQEILTYIRYYWSSKYGLTREKELYSNIKSKIREKNQVITFLKNLEENSAFYIALTNPTHQIWNELPKECSEYISELLELRLYQNRPLLLAILAKWKKIPDEIKKVIKIILSWSVRNLITGSTGAGTLEQEFSRRAKLINDGSITSAKQLKESIQNLIPTDKEFEDAFKIATISKSYIARYYLRKLEISYRTTKEISPLQNPEKVTLEHILPENPNNLTSDWADFDENKYRSYYKRIGNLTLLDKDINSEIKNGKFDLKKEFYNSSEIFITKNIARYDKWTSSEIEQRQKEFAESAIRIWDIEI